jgi:hypothetical protein
LSSAKIIKLFARLVFWFPIKCIFNALNIHLRNRDLIKKVIVTKYKHSSTRPCNRCLPDSVKGLKRAVILSLIKLRAFMTSDATNGTIIIAAIIATIKMTIRHARFMFMAPPSPRSGLTQMYFHLILRLNSLKSPQIKISQAAASKIS